MPLVTYTYYPMGLRLIGAGDATAKPPDALGFAPPVAAGQTGVSDDPSPGAASEDSKTHDKEPPAPDDKEEGA